MGTPTRHDGGAPPVLVDLPSGGITLRDARTGTSRTVELAAFSIGATTVTAAHWHRVLAGTTTAGITTAGAGTAVVPGSTQQVPAHPVTWFEAVAWCNAASAADGLPAAYTVHGRKVEWEVASPGYRLPTEAEWEHACRAGTSGPRHGELAAIAWTRDDAVERPQPVALKEPNAFGLHDTLGNVWEWCWDHADTARYADYRSLRGGGWADPPYSVRASVRRGSAPDARLEDVRFRIARGAAGPAGARAGQGWSAAADARRADVRGPLPLGWTPLRGLRP
ncbi:formylglycine-generating enzyme family protein [Arthrobacter sp. JSM 101049]|uniref:formylglycine-generating enzyme family protein n=1 Tax=Arthrobacter sp. JSM 101049 TaxID=929097 RepID=UPI003569032E